MKTPYPPQEQGVWTPISRNIKISCCDCGLCHEIFFKVVKGTIWWSVHLDPKATSMHRILKDFRCQPIKTQPKSPARAKRRA